VENGNNKTLTIIKLIIILSKSRED